MYADPKAQSSTGDGEAQEIAIEALIWLAEDAERLQRFLALSGLGPQNLRAAAAEPGFLAAVLDHLSAHEPTFMAFANHANRAPETVIQAHRRLAGGQAPDDS